MKLISVLATLFLLNIANAQVKVPEKIIGNWINEESNDWEYGLFETLAVYKSDFWEYENLAVRKNTIRITLRKDNQFERIELKTGSDPARLTITHSSDKPISYRVQTTRATPYTTPDDKPFRNSGFNPDTVTIIGYYRNLDQYLASNARQKGPFSVTVYEFIEDEYSTYYADFDSLGRFIIKFPVLNAQEIVVDRGRLSHIDVVEPGERIFVFADLADYIPKEDGTISKHQGKRIRFMGGEARVHNELAAYTPSDADFNAYDPTNQELSDLSFQKAARAVYDVRMHHLERYLESYPTASRRFTTYQRVYEKYRLLYDLMQHQYKKLKGGDVVFEDGYMEVVTSMMDISNATYFTLVQYYGSVVEDYIGYHVNVESFYRNGTWKMSVSDADVLNDLKNNRAFSEQDLETISQFIQADKVVRPHLVGVTDTAKARAILAPFKSVLTSVDEMTTRLAIKDSLSAWRGQLLDRRKRDRQTAQIDSLIKNEALRQLLTARMLSKIMKRELRPLSQENRKLLKERITIQPIFDYMVASSNRYAALEAAKTPYLASLKNTDHLKEAEDAEALFKELVSLYNGKVIYMDFWGTWCGPCRTQMPYVSELKKELEDKDVIFMYLANRSPERTWLNFIKEMNLTGANVVHYRLPEEQQAMIERKFSVHKFPTYLLFDKGGNLVLRDAPRPQEKAAVIGAINKLL